MNDDEEPIPQDPIETDVIDEGEQQQPQTEDVPKWRPTEGLKELEDQLFLMIMRCITLKNFKWWVIALHLKKS
jgi:hypothetical protein